MSNPEFDLNTKLLEWQDTAREARRLVALEMEMRKAIFAHAFPDPKEGVNNYDLGAGYKLKADHKVNRKILEEALPAVIAKLKQEAIDPAILDQYLKIKYDLKVGPYKALPADSALKGYLDMAVESKDGAPTLEIVEPKAKK